MMNRQTNLILALTFLIALGTASTASADGSVFLGTNFPTGDFNTVAEAGVSLGGYYTADLSPIVDFGGFISYNDFSFFTDLLPIIGELFGESANTWEFHALGQIKFLFLKGFLGLGLANYTGLDDNLESTRKTRFSWQGGLAVQFLVLEARLGFHQIPLDNGSANWVNLSLGVVF